MMMYHEVLEPYISFFLFFLKWIDTSLLFAPKIFFNII